MPRLYRYATQGTWHKIPKRCKTRPREAKFIHRYVPNDTALHRLLRAGGSPDHDDGEAPKIPTDSAILKEVAQLLLEAVYALVEANPSIVCVSDSFGRTPLHLACMNVEQVSVQVVEILLEACPKVASVQDLSGSVPLDYLLAKEQQVPCDLIKKLATVTPVQYLRRQTEE